MGKRGGGGPARPLAASDFQGPSDPLRTPPDSEALFRRSGPAAPRRDFGPARRRREEKKTPSGRPADVSGSAPALPPRDPGSERRAFDRLPFRRERNPSDDAGPGRARGRRAPIVPSSKSISGLGSANSRPIAVLAKPFSASALELPARTLATTTKIRTGERCAPGRPGSFFENPAFVYSSGRFRRDVARRPEGAVRGSGGSSVIDFRGRFIRRVSRYTLLGGFRLP